MRIGYACLTVGVHETDFKTCIMKNASPEKLTELIEHNLSILDRILDYNIKNHIRLFRISSDIIPFGSSPVNTLNWPEVFGGRLAAMGRKALDNGMRLSMHPGQYTVLNSPDEDVVARAVEDLLYHCAFLDAMGLGREHKMILHIGGAYGDKSTAAKRFKENYDKLPDHIKKRLVIENDDKLYTAAEVLDIGLDRGIPVVFDTLHHEINPGQGEQDVYFWLNQCRSTWKKEDGPQKIHYSQQAEGKTPGSHSETIGIDSFLNFYNGIPSGTEKAHNEKTDTDLDIDIMLEVKDKNLSALKCIHCLALRPKIKDLEEQWARYKYTVLERSPKVYQEIRELLKDKTAYPAVEFYQLIEQITGGNEDQGQEKSEEARGRFINGAEHVWGYFKARCTEGEKKTFAKNIELFCEGKCSENRVKSQLKRLAVKYDQKYLLESYYFTTQ